jgi:energy-coupling factor transport system permease protein
LKRSTFDPRSKLIVASVATVLLMIFNHWSFLTASLGILAVIVLILHLGRPYLNFLKNLGFAGLTFFIIAYLAFDLITGIVSGLRLLTIGTTFFLFFQTTSPGMLSNGLLKMGLPYPFAFVLSASMQFVPVLIRRARNIRDAQRARGIPIEGSLGTLLHLPALAGPLLIQAFKFADELAEAMEARGFGISGRSFRYELRFRWSDWMAVTISLIALTIALSIQFF